MSMLPVGFGGSVAAYDIAKSVRFRASGSAYLSRTPASAGNRKKWTWSGWFKRGRLGVAGYLLGSGTSSSDYCTFGFLSGDTLYFQNNGSGGNQIGCTSSAVFRDPSAHCHAVIAIDTAQATASAGVRVWVNGVQQTMSFATYTQNTDTLFNGTTPNIIGDYLSGGGAYFDGYLSEINFIDGQALDASIFGEFDANGVWQPKKYTGTYGTNGFYLPFNDGTTLTNLCLDRSGNANNWTASGVSLTAGVNYDWMDDTPTNNFAVLNPLATAFPPSSGNLTISPTGAGYSGVGSVLMPTGKWYCEAVQTAGTAYMMLGVARTGAAMGTAFWLNPGGYAYYASTGEKYNNGVGSAFGSAFTLNDIIGVAFDADNGTLQFYKNGVSQGVAFTGLTQGDFVFAIGNGSGVSHTHNINFGQRPFAYTPPTGFKAISTKNRPTGGSITTSGMFTGNASTDGPFVWLNGNPSTMTINGNAVTFGTHADKTAGGFKVRSSSASYNTAGSNTYSVSVTGKLFGDSSRAPNTAQGNP